MTGMRDSHTHYLMRLSKYYQQATLLPFLITIVITSIFIVLENKSYRSEWFTPEAVIGMGILMTFLYCLMMNVLCLTIFLCKLEGVRNNRLLTFLSWFLLPLSPCIFIIIHEYRYYLDIGLSSASNDLQYLGLLNGPFIIGLIWSFIRYRKALKTP